MLFYKIQLNNMSKLDKTFKATLEKSSNKGGWTYIIGQGVLGWGYSVAGIPVAVIGFGSTRIRTHTTMGIVIFVWQVVFGFDVSPLLHR